MSPFDSSRGQSRGSGSEIDFGAEETIHQLYRLRYDPDLGGFQARPFGGNGDRTSYERGPKRDAIDPAFCV